MKPAYLSLPIMYHSRPLFRYTPDPFFASTTPAPNPPGKWILIPFAVRVGSCRVTCNKVTNAADEESHLILIVSGIAPVGCIISQTKPCRHIFLI